MSATEDPPRDDDQGDGEGGGKERIPGRWIAISLATIVVIGAALGILQTDAGVNESNTARETTRTAVGAMRAGVLERAGRQLERDITAESDAFRREQESVVDRARSAGASAPPLTLEELRGVVVPGSDLPRARTEEQVRALAFDAERLTLSQAALAETRVTWNDRSTQYTTAISMLAVALFLVGFAVVLHGPRRTLFYVLGIGFGLIVLGWAGHIYSLSIPETSEDAIAATARGRVDAAQGRQEQAITEFTRAIDIEGDYDAPYRGRATAVFLRANPDFRVTGAVTSDQAVLEKAIADARRALELGGGRDSLTFTLISLLSLYSGEYDDAVQAADEAIAINGKVPDIRLVKSAAEVGRGDAAAARAALEGALGLLKGSDPSERTRGLVSQYVTYLEQVIATSPEQTALARELEQELIALEAGFNRGSPVSGAAPGRGTAVVEGLRYAGDRLRLRLRWTGLPPKTALTAIAFERPTPDGPWVQPRDLALFRTVSGDGEEAISVPLERACTPTEVRVDVYLDGAPVESVTGPGGTPTC